jgi:hypothetical protein
LEDDYRKTVTKTNFSAKIRLFFKSRKITYKLIDFMGDWFWKIIVFKNRCSLYGLNKAIMMNLGIINERSQSAFKVNAEPLRRILDLRESGIYVSGDAVRRTHCEGAVEDFWTMREAI